MSGYRGRFAPSPTGPLHAGSLVAALASWLDARAHDGVWLVRIENVDRPRCVAGADAVILAQLADCGLFPDEPPVRQSERGALYQSALLKLVETGAAYPCGCSRRDIELASVALGRRPRRGEELIYPGTCRDGLHGRAARAWRFKIGLGATHDAFIESNRGNALVQRSWEATYSVANEVVWEDRRIGVQRQDVAHSVGDFVLRRADGLWAYQLAVVVDDADQRISDVVRGEDLADNTPRQILLQRALGLPTPRLLHTPLVLGADGEKLSKQNGAEPLDLSDPLAALNAAAGRLELPTAGPTVGAALSRWVEGWRERFGKIEVATLRT